MSSGDFKEAVKKRMEDANVKNITHMTPQGLVRVKPGKYRLPSGLEFRLEDRDMPNLEKLMREGKIEHIAGKRSRRFTRKTKNKKHGFTRSRK
jgi:hypothetical protein